MRNPFKMIWDFDPLMLDFFFSMFAMLLAYVTFDFSSTWRQFPNYVVLATGFFGLCLFMLTLVKCTTSTLDDFAKMFTNFMLAGSMIVYAHATHVTHSTALSVCFVASAVVMILCGIQSSKRLKKRDEAKEKKAHTGRIMWTREVG